MQTALLSTGQVAQQLETSERRIQDLIRRAKVDPPPLVAGRRAWRPEDVERMRKVLEENR